MSRVEIEIKKISHRGNRSRLFIHFLDRRKIYKTASSDKSKADISEYEYYVILQISFLSVPENS